MMLKTLITLILFYNTLVSFSQNEENFTLSDFHSFLEENFHWPSIAFDENIYSTTISYNIFIDSTEKFNVIISNDIHPSLFYEANRVVASHPQWDNLTDSAKAREKAYIKQLLVCKNNKPHPLGGANRKSSYLDKSIISEEQILFAKEFYNWSKKLHWRTSDYASFQFPKHVYVKNPSLSNITYVINRKSREIIKPEIYTKDSSLVVFSLNRKTEYILVSLKLEDSNNYFTYSTFSPNNQTIIPEYELTDLIQLKDNLMGILKTK